jgi:precorrin-6B methylase 2
VNAGELRAALAASCDFADGVFVARGRTDLAYADGGEAYVASVVANSTDIATGSPELARAIRDWASQYHLSSARANLLRPLGLSRDLCTLEIGAGCGAITRYLGETCGTVLALEGNLARARIAASRCRDLENVVVVCADFPGFAVPGAFDLVTLVGVLEYSRMYVEAAEPVQAVLEAARGRLGAGGRLAIAIENQLGLKYLAGSPEDHLGQPYVGVIGGYGEKTPATFGRGELRDRLGRAGFEAVEFLYPFPDYKLPSAIVTDAGFTNPRFNASDLVATSYGHRFGEPESRAYSESLARDVFVRNGLGADTANSLLAIAGLGPAAKRDALAYAYTVGRDRPYASATHFVDEGASIAVERRAMFEGATGSVAHTREARERYLEGEVLYRSLERILARPGWTVEALTAWASPWVELLQKPRSDLVQTSVIPTSRSEPGQTSVLLPAKFFDCTPFNVVRRADGTLATFDLEWPAPGGAEVALAHVVFRGLYNGLLRVEFVAAPAPGVPTHIPTLAAATMIQLGLETPPDTIHEWIAADYQLTGRIAGIPRATAMPFLPSLRIAGTDAGEDDAAARLRESEQLLERAVQRGRELAGRARELDSILARPHHRLATWVGDLIEPFPRLRAAARAPFEVIKGGPRPRTGAIVHLYYDDLWPEIARYLANAAPWTQVYVSIRADAPASLEAAIAADFAHAKVRRVANRGRDVWPFLEALEMARRDGIEILCKIHGKRSPHVATGEAWRRDMLDKLLGSPEAVQHVLDALRADASIGIIGPGGYIVPSSHYWEHNAERVTELATRMGADAKTEFHYVAGSMFWARVAALVPLLSLGLREVDFSSEPAPVDGDVSHAIERCIPLAARKAGFTLRETANISAKTVLDFAP